MEVNTTDPNDSFAYWAGQDPTDDIQVLNGQYWQSAHWTKEYILHLKFKSTEKWWSEFVKQNNLIRVPNDWPKSSDFPDWFQPSSRSEIFVSPKDSNESRYFRDSATGICYIYEIQL
jgi:hypothetical protein